MGKIQHAPPLRDVSVKDDFWSPIQKLITDVVIPYQGDILEDKIPGVEKSHAIENFKIAAGESKEAFYGMVFQDSDVAKWLEAVAYSLTIKPDPQLEKRADDVIALIGRAQQADGYMDTYFIVKEPSHKWQNLWQCHELYCAGHMIEAAVAYQQATGKDNFLTIVRKNADLICNYFGVGKHRGCPGHQEVEIGLLRLYRLTGERKYLDTAKFFLDVRGTEPEFFAQEASTHGFFKNYEEPDNREYAQTYAPVRKQDRAVGHAVRAAYMYSAMADLASETDDAELAAACRRLWNDVVNRQMYITGGIGSSVYGEAFTVDYELPNDLVYAETCASVAMTFFARRMLELEVKGEYADILEKELFNGVLAGMQLDGKRFFYVNPLEVVPGVSGKLKEYKHVLPKRPSWYACACCPPNVARLLSSIGKYAWGESSTCIYSHFFLGSVAAFRTAGGVQIECESAYPENGSIRYVITPAEATANFTFAVHIPGWCKNWTVYLNEEKVDAVLQDGYVKLARSWSAGDAVRLSLEMAPQRMYANTHVRADAGCVALQRGPLVYCLEGVDNGEDLSALRLLQHSELRETSMADKTLGTFLALEASGIREVSGADLYSATPPQEHPVTLRAIPYYMWGNREEGGMRVWIHAR